MYYSFSCTYCRRVFYTYDSNKHRAAITLYRTIKQHLIDYDEDKKEYELDDGEHMDTNQIYAEMKTSQHAPSGAHHATQTTNVVYHSKKNESVPAHTSHKNSLDSSFILLIFLLILLFVIICLFFIFPDIFKIEFPQLAL